MASKKKIKKTKKKTAPSRKAKAKAKMTSACHKAPTKKATKARAIQKRPRGSAGPGELVGYQPRGLGAFSAGQSGDIQGIPARLRADSESVEELLEEGQTFEAEAIAGVENAPDPDESEVVTHEVPQDDVPEEYRERE